MKTTEPNSPLNYLPPAMWGAGALGWLGCHAIKVYIFPHAVATPIGFAAGSMLACPIAAVCALIAGCVSRMIHKNYAGFCQNLTFVAAFPLVCYHFSMMASTGVAITAGSLLIASLVLSVMIAMALYFPLMKSDAK